MKIQYIIQIPKNAEKAILATCELYGQTFKNYKKLEISVENYDLKLTKSYHIDTFLDDLNNGKIDLEDYNYIPVKVKEKNEYRR